MLLNVMGLCTGGCGSGNGSVPGGVRRMKQVTSPGWHLSVALARIAREKVRWLEQTCSGNGKGGGGALQAAEGGCAMGTAGMETVQGRCGLQSRCPIHGDQSCHDVPRWEGKVQNLPALACRWAGLPGYGFGYGRVGRKSCPSTTVQMRVAQIRMLPGGMRLYPMPS